MEAKFVLTVSTQADYELLSKFLNATGIQSKLLSYITEPTVCLSKDEMNTFKYLPSAAFKAFCGAENLNQAGHISLRSAYDLVLDYAQGYGLYHHTHIDLNPVLAEALNSEKHSILISDLLPTFINLFKMA